MSYLVLARKWRPQTFEDLVGQEHVSRTLQNAIGSGRVAHAFLFTGARGVGKTSAARILAKALECERGPLAEPCNSCPQCGAITAGNSPDVFEIDGASNTGVEDIRELRENIKYLPSGCRYKIFIIDEVHMLSTSAFNALLKTLEEPPPHVKFIFATTEPHKVPITILSRCQRFDFKRISTQKIVARLRHITDQEGITVSEAALTAIAAKGDGSMRDSLSTLDQVLAFCGDTVGDDQVAAILGVVDRRLLIEASRAVFSRECGAVLDLVRRVDDSGHSMRHFCQELIGHFRNLTIAGLTENAAELLDLAEGELAEVRTQAAAVTVEELQRHIAILLKAEAEMASSGFPRLVLEMALVRMASLVPVVPVREILDRLKALEGARVGGAGGGTPPPVRKPQPSVPSQQSAPIQQSSPGQTPVSSQSSAPGRPVDAAHRGGGTGPRVEGRPEAEAGWPGFVEFVKGRKVSLGSQLEHGRPLAVSAESLKIGFPTGSFFLTSLKDPDTLAQLRELAHGYFRGRPAIELVPLPPEAADLPPSMMEERSLRAEERKAELRREATSHPAVVAALEVFGGEVNGIEEIGEDASKSRR